MTALIGIVSNHAHTIFRVTPHRTALARFADPTPIIEPVMVWVVLTGIPASEHPMIVPAAAVSAANPWIGRNFATFCPSVFITPHPPARVPDAIAACADNITQMGTVS